MGTLKTLVLVVAALGFLAWVLTRGQGKWSSRAQETQERLAGALRERARAQAAQEEEQAHEDLQEKRRGSLADRLAGALERARERAGAAE